MVMWSLASFSLWFLNVIQFTTGSTPAQFTTGLVHKRGIADPFYVWSSLKNNFFTDLMNPSLSVEKLLTNQCHDLYSSINLFFCLYKYFCFTELSQ